VLWITASGLAAEAVRQRAAGLRCRHPRPYGGCRGAAAVQATAIRIRRRDRPPFLVNTSFNGFREPIVWSPRDAIRVFYGSGLDLLVLDRFVLSK
jgi:hypothetical protein